jgi:hypothetical protein
VGAWGGRIVILGLPFIQKPKLRNGLLAFYRLSDTFDSSGNNRTLTNNGGVTFASGKIGNAAVFDGASYFSQPAISVAGGSFTISQWLNVSSSQYEVFSETVSKWAGFIMQGSFVTGLNENEANSFFAYCRTDEGAFPLYVFANFDEWAHFVFRVDNDSKIISLFKNGTLSASNSITGDIVSSEGSTELQIGAGESDGSFPLNDGKIDAVGIWSRALSDAEIALLYNSGSGREL